MIIVDILIGWLVIKIVKERWVDLLSGENYCVMMVKLMMMMMIMSE